MAIYINYTIFRLNIMMLDYFISIQILKFIKPEERIIIAITQIIQIFTSDYHVTFKIIYFIYEHLKSIFTKF